MTDMANYGADRNSTIRRSWAQHGLARGGAPLSAKLDRACRLALYETQAATKIGKSFISLTTGCGLSDS
jgi:hypothetical protein